MQLPTFFILPGWHLPLVLWMSITNWTVNACHRRIRWIRRMRCTTNRSGWSLYLKLESLESHTNAKGRKYLCTYILFAFQLFMISLCPSLQENQFLLNSLSSNCTFQPCTLFYLSVFGNSSAVFTSSEGQTCATKLDSLDIKFQDLFQPVPIEPV